ncbi:hypothetical protein [Barrientosiimonas endolithica]|nr:hypothetical protein [Barrientosiimonas endolithica]
MTDALVDLGKTRCRLRLVSEGQVLTEGSGGVRRVSLRPKGFRPQPTPC